MAQAAEIARAGPTLRDKWTISFGLPAVCGLAWAAMAWQAGAMMKMGRGPLFAPLRLLHPQVWTFRAVPP